MWPFGSKPELPSSLLKSLNRVEKGAPQLLLLRHADRDRIKSGSWGEEMPINERGVRMAAALGKHLKARHPWALSGEVLRCRQTAALAVGSTPEAIETSPLLGVPGAFVADRERGEEAFRNVGTRGIIRRMVAGPVPEGFRGLAEGTRVVCDAMAGLLRERGGTGVLITQDAIIVPLVVQMFGVSLESRWVSFMEGVVFTRSRAGDLLAIWEDRTVTVPEGAGRA